MIESVFTELGTLIIIAVAISGVMRLFRQPLIIGYIITGVLAGPAILNIVKSTEIITTLSHFGVVFLLFIAGLSLNPRILKRVGKISLITGTGQVLFTTIAGFFIARLLGFMPLEALYIAVALTFSSTIIILKLLSDKGDLETLYGRISIGFLIVQDIIAIIILMAISASTGGQGTSLEAVFIGMAAFVIIAVVGYFSLPMILASIAKSPEFLFLFSIGWLLLIAIVFGYMNLSIEIGALLAGISLSVSPYQSEIKSKMNTLRDFFILFFFVLLGSQMVFTDISGFLLPVIIFSAFILVGNPLIVMFLMGFFKYTKRNSFLAGLTVAQISEFSLILVALGVKVGHIPSNILGLVTAVGLITIFGSTYMILHSNTIYPHLSSFLGVFERRGKKVDEHMHHKKGSPEVVLFGCNRIGYSLIEEIRKMTKRFLVIDYNPETIDRLERMDGVNCRYGDADDTEMLNSLDFSGTRMVISTIKDMDANLMIMKKVKKANRDAAIMVVSQQIDDAMELYRKGATYVIMPYFLGGTYISSMIKKHGLRLSEYYREGAKQLRNLKMRSKLKHEHPRTK